MTVHWRLQAECREHDPELFFPEHSGGPQAREAKEVCGRCAVREKCAQWAVEVGVEYGVWGGTTAADRRHMGVKPIRLERQLKPCGTQAAYDRHIKRGEPVDDECREANRARQAARRARNKAAAAAPAGAA